MKPVTIALTLALCTTTAFAGPTNKLTKHDLEAAQKLDMKKKTFKQYVDLVSAKLGKPMKTQDGYAYWYGADGNKCFSLMVSKSSDGGVSNTGIQEALFDKAECDK